MDTGDIRMGVRAALISRYAFSAVVLAHETWDARMAAAGGKRRPVVLDEREVSAGVKTPRLRGEDQCSFAK